MLNKRTTIFATVVTIAAASLFFTQSANAMWPVIDVGEIAQTIEVVNHLEEQYQQMRQQYETLQNQYSQMKEQYKSITGNYGWGNFQNSLSDLKQKREWAASNWQDALKGMAGGNKSRYQQLLKQYKQNHSTLSQTTFAKGTDKDLAVSYQNQVKTNQASAATSTYEFNDINKHLQSIQQLGQQIEDAKKNNDLKSAIDLNSRISLEVAYVSTEELRMQTLLNQQMAQGQASKIAEENEAATYNQAGENPQ